VLSGLPRRTRGGARDWALVGHAPAWGWVGDGDVKMAEDAVGDGGVGDEGDDLHPPVAERALQDINREDAPQERWSWVQLARVRTFLPGANPQPA